MQAAAGASVTSSSAAARLSSGWSTPILGASVSCQALLFTVLAVSCALWIGL